MSEVNQIDQQLLTSLKKKIEEIAGLDGVDSLAQKDLEFIRFFVEENSGVSLSLSTVKRIWRGDHQRLPHLSTLNALSQIAYKKDWQSHKKEHLETLSGHDEKKTVTTKNSKLLPIGISVGVCLFLFMMFWSRKSEKLSVVSFDPTKIIFECKSSVSNQVPNSVLFNYNIDNIEADKFYIQQSWDPERRVEIQKGNYEQTDIYYRPGYYFAKLIADDSIIKQIPVHITYPNWYISTEQDGNRKYLKPSEIKRTEYLGIEPSVYENGKIDMQKNINQYIFNSKEFKTSGEDFTFSTRFKMFKSDDIQCPMLGIVIKGTDEYIYIPSALKGCESEINIKVSDSEISGKTNDLMAFGTDIYEWQKMDIHVKDKSLAIKLNDQSIYNVDYNDNMGSIKEITYLIRGHGIVNDIVLKDSLNNIIIDDHF